MPLLTLTAGIMDALQGRFGSASSAPEVIAEGAWSRAYAFTVGEGELVVRVGTYGDDYLKDAAVARLLAASQVPVPRVIACGEIGGVCYAVTERVHGTAFDDLDAEQVAQVLPSLLGALDEIRSAADVRHTAGFGMWRPDGSAPYPSWAQALLAVDRDNPRLPGWRNALAGSEVGSGAFEQGLRRLRELVACLPDARELVHGDLLSRNVLACGDKVTGVLDWGNSMYGDSLYDAAWLIYWWPWYPQWASLDIHQSISDHLRTRGRSADLEERLLAYEIHIALDAIAYCAFKQRWDDVARHAQSIARLTAR